MLTLLAIADRLVDLLNLLLLPVIIQNKVHLVTSWRTQVSIKAGTGKIEQPDTCHDVFFQQPLKDNDLSFLQPFAARFTRCYQTFRKLSAGNPESTLKGHNFNGDLRLNFIEAHHSTWRHYRSPSVWEWWPLCLRCFHHHRTLQSLLLVCSSGEACRVARSHSTWREWRADTKMSYKINLLSLAWG